MNQQQIRDRLLELKQQLEAEDAATEADRRPVELDQACVGRLSRMDAMQQQAMAHETARRRQRQLAAVEGALERVAAGEYGFCFVCGEEIEPGRLAVDPTNTRCISCAEKT